MNKEKKVKPYYDDLNANKYNLFPRKGLKAYFSIITQFPEPPYIPLTRIEIATVFGNALQSLNYVWKQLYF